MSICTPTIRLAVIPNANLKNREQRQGTTVVNIEPRKEICSHHRPTQSIALRRTQQTKENNVPKHQLLSRSQQKKLIPSQQRQTKGTLLNLDNNPTACPPTNGLCCWCGSRAFYSKIWRLMWIYICGVHVIIEGYTALHLYLILVMSRESNDGNNPSNSKLEDIPLKEIAKVLQSGGRILRSIKSSASSRSIEPIETRTK